jgi:hypothetical protein
MRLLDAMEPDVAETVRKTVVPQQLLPTRCSSSNIDNPELHISGVYNRCTHRIHSPSSLLLRA